VAVRRGHVGAGRHGQFENAQPALFGAIDQVVDFQQSDLDALTVHGDLLG
jgi:hypothetical protein